MANYPDNRCFDSGMVSPIPIDDDRYLTACHEAGHAVAARMRGGEVVSVTIKPTARHGGRSHIRRGSADAADFWAFETYAGPWAEARAQWTQPAIDEDTFDDEGRCFADHVATVFADNPDDYSKYQWEVGNLSAIPNAQYDAMMREHVAPRVTPLVGTGTWDSELEGRWPVIQEVAERLLAAEQETLTGDDLFGER